VTSTIADRHIPKSKKLNRITQRWQTSSVEYPGISGESDDHQSLNFFLNVSLIKQNYIIDLYVGENSGDMDFLSF
jgi:hypothetical protein